MPFQLTLYYILLLSYIIMKIVLVPLFYLSGILQGIIDRPTLFFDIKSSKKTVGITELSPALIGQYTIPLRTGTFASLIISCQSFLRISCFSHCQCSSCRIDRMTQLFEIQHHRIRTKSVFVASFQVSSRQFDQYGFLIEL